MPLKKRARSFASTHDDRERAGTVSGSNSPGGAGSSHPPKSVCAHHDVDPNAICILAAGATKSGRRRGRTCASKHTDAKRRQSKGLLSSKHEVDRASQPYTSRQTECSASVTGQCSSVLSQPVTLRTMIDAELSCMCMCRRRRKCEMGRPVRGAAPPAARASAAAARVPTAPARTAPALARCSRPPACCCLSRP